MFLNPVLKRSLLEVSGWKSLCPCSHCCQAVVLAGQAVGRRPAPLSWMNHQSLTDNHFMYRKAAWAGFIEVALFCLTAVTFWYFFVVGWHLCIFFFFFLHCFVFRDFVNALCTRLQSSMRITECSLVVNVIQKSSYWWQPCVKEELQSTRPGGMLWNAPKIDKKVNVGFQYLNELLGFCCKAVS